MQVLNFLLRSPAEMRAQIERTTVGSTDTSRDAAQAKGFCLGYNKVRSHKPMSVTRVPPPRMVGYQLAGHWLGIS